MNLMLHRHLNDASIQETMKNVFCQLICLGELPTLLSVCWESIWTWWVAADDWSGRTASSEPPFCWFNWASHLLLHFKISIRIHAPHITTPNPANVASRIAKTAPILVCHSAISNKCINILTHFILERFWSSKFLFFIHNNSFFVFVLTLLPRGRRPW